eukprot:Rhum_TRINITY_DN15575_c0_g1::Rhum_TRINITY_DN15575_c0_g1_i1::g.161303::m.161303
MLFLLREISAKNPPLHNRNAHQDFQTRVWHVRRRTSNIVRLLVFFFLIFLLAFSSVSVRVSVCVRVLFSSPQRRKARTHHTKPTHVLLLPGTRRTSAGPPIRRSSAPRELELPLELAGRRRRRHLAVQRRRHTHILPENRLLGAADVRVVTGDVGVQLRRVDDTAASALLHVEPHTLLHLVAPHEADRRLDHRRVHLVLRDVREALPLVPRLVLVRLLVEYLVHRLLQTPPVRPPLQRSRHARLRGGRQVRQRHAGLARVRGDEDQLLLLCGGDGAAGVARVAVDAEGEQVQELCVRQVRREPHVAVQPLDVDEALRLQQRRHARRVRGEGQGEPRRRRQPRPQRVALLHARRDAEGGERCVVHADGGTDLLEEHAVVQVVGDLEGRLVAGRRVHAEHAAVRLRDEGVRGGVAGLERFCAASPLHLRLQQAEEVFGLGHALGALDGARLLQRGAGVVVGARVVVSLQRRHAEGSQHGGHVVGREAAGRRAVEEGGHVDAFGDVAVVQQAHGVRDGGRVAHGVAHLLDVALEGEARLRLLLRRRVVAAGKAGLTLQAAARHDVERLLLIRKPRIRRVDVHADAQQVAASAEHCCALKTTPVPRAPCTGLLGHPHNTNEVQIL